MIEQRISAQPHSPSQTQKTRKCTILQTSEYHYGSFLSKFYLVAECNCTEIWPMSSEQLINWPAWSMSLELPILFKIILDTC